MSNGSELSPLERADRSGALSQSPTMRLTEAVLLLLLDKKSGDLEPVRPWALAYALSGAVLMDLSLLNRIDTDTRALVLLDPTPTHDAMLDSALAEIAGSTEKHSTRYWLDHFAERAEELKGASLGALVERGILEGREDGFLVLAGGASQVKGEAPAVFTLEGEVRLRIMQCLHGSAIPDPKDAMIVCLADACGLLAGILSPPELDSIKPRLELMRQLDQIGRAVSGAIWEVQPPARKPMVRTTEPVPDARGLPLVGNGIDMARDMIQFLLRQYRLLGPVFRIRAPGRRYIVMAGVSANRLMSHRGKECLRSADVWHDFSNALGAWRMMPGMDGAEHFRFRRAQRDGYARAALDNRAEDAVGIARREALRWGASPTPVMGAMQRIVTEQLGTIVAGTSPREYIDDLVGYFRSLLAVYLTRERPAIWQWNPRFRRARRRVFELYERVRTTHLERPVHLRQDLIDDLMQLHESDPQHFPETDHKVAMLGPFIAGLDTVSAMCSFMLYAVLEDRDVMQQATQEADAFFSGEPISAARLDESSVVRRIVLETLRRYPLVPGVVRRASNTFEFEGCTVAAGEQVMVATTLPHFLPEFFPNPWQFDIGRYTEERMEHRQPGAFAPFGLGAHHCLGSSFAEWQMALNLLTILHAVELEMYPSHYRLRIRQTPTRHPRGCFRLRVKARRH